MDTEFLKRLADYFTAAELVDLLGIDVGMIIHNFDVEIEDAYEDLEEIMFHGK